MRSFRFIPLKNKNAQNRNTGNYMRHVKLFFIQTQYDYVG